MSLARTLFERRLSERLRTLATELMDAVVDIACDPDADAYAVALLDGAPGSCGHGTEDDTSDDSATASAPGPAAAHGAAGRCSAGAADLATPAASGSAAPSPKVRRGRRGGKRLRQRQAEGDAVARSRGNAATPLRTVADVAERTRGADRPR